jgi:Mechanosensitive ion channel, conserved TM helix
MNESPLILPLQESLYDSLDMIITFLPNIVGALVLVTVGIILGRLVSSTMRRIMKFANLDRHLDNWGITAFFQQFGIQQPGAMLVGALSFWFIVLLFLISAARTLELDVITEALISLAYALPDLILAILIVLVGLFGAKALRTLVTTLFDSTGLPAARMAGNLIYALCTLVVGIMAASKLGFDTSFLGSFILILAAGSVATLALSIGLGAGPAIRNLIGTYSVRHFVQIGQEVQVGEMTGKVVDLTSMVIVLDVNGKKVVIPASRLNDAPTTINPQES